MNFRLREISINVNKLLAVLLLPVFLSAFFILHFVVACLFLYPLLFYFSKLMLLLYFCLFFDHVNKPIIFVFEAFVYQTIFFFQNQKVVLVFGENVFCSSRLSQDMTLHDVPMMSSVNIILSGDPFCWLDYLERTCVACIGRLALCRLLRHVVAFR